MIEVRGVSKRFGTTVALDGVSMSIERGSILGFLGPNGAGKSTAMKIITTFLAADSGEVLVDGLNVADKPLAVRKKIGYLPENLPLYHDMRVHEYLSFVGESRGLRGQGLRQRLDWVVESCGIAGVYKKTIRELSKGYKQRTGLAQALIHDPEILILDEPTSGLDPLQIIGIRELILDLGRSKTIIFSTHILQEVQPITDRVAIINEGRIIADGRIPDLKKKAMVNNRVFISFDQTPDNLAGELGQISGFEALIACDAAAAPERFELRGAFGKDLVGSVSSLARSRDWSLRELQESHYSLEDTFIALTKQAANSVAESGTEVQA
ncbi:MAG: ATP-binding cassette domain-containing protein [bacterium]|nr:ATP-binding cassette domain-containing protein [bacterium]